MPLIKSTLQSTLETLFSSMSDNATNKGFADGIANEVDSFWKSGIINTNGQGNLVGTTGTGSVS